jgi:MFS superfamily sulfate permease-like transporter
MILGLFIQVVFFSALIGVAIGISFICFELVLRMIGWALKEGGLETAQRKESDLVARRALQPMAVR